MNTPMLPCVLTSSIEHLESRVAPATLVFPDPSDLDGFYGFQINGETASARAGFTVASAGDVNGDGIADLVIGSITSGAYVVFGKTNAFPREFNLSTLNGANGFQIIGGPGVSFFTAYAASAGDVNHDGFDDVVVSSSGVAYVIFGKAKGFPATLSVSSLDGTNGFRAVSGTIGEFLGPASGVGDLNGDGVDDIVLTSPNADHNFERSGSLYVVYGKNTTQPGVTFAAEFDLSKLTGANGYRLDGETTFDGSQMTATHAGDVNDDGLSDILIGMPSAENTGKAYVVFGKAADATATIGLSSLDGSTGFIVTGAQGNDQTGRSVAGVGDFNGDGIDDIVIGAPFANPANSFDRGIAYVVFGQPSGTDFPASLNVADLDGDNGFRLNGEFQSDFFGMAVGGPGDVNGDGFADLLIGAPNQDTGRGAVYLVLGSDDAFDADVEIATLLSTFTAGKGIGEHQGDNAGSAVSSAGDINGDGVPDIVIGAQQADPKGTDSGAGYVVFGRDLSQVTLIGGGRIATFLDGDFDRVFVKTTKGFFTTDNFTVVVTQDGPQLALIDLLEDPAFTGAKLTITAQRTILGGDGAVRIGHIDATDVPLNRLTIAGYLAEIDALSLKTLRTGALGGFSPPPLGAPNADGVSEIDGRLGMLKVRTDIVDTTLALGTLGKMNVGGGLLGVELFVNGVTPSEKARANVVISKINVIGDVTDSQILAGYDFTGAGSLADVQIGTVIVGGNWKRSDLVAGIEATDGFFGNDDDTVIADGGNIVSRIARVVIKGGASGSVDPGDHFGIVAERVVAVSIHKVPLTLTKPGIENILVPGSDDFRVREVA